MKAFSHEWSDSAIFTSDKVMSEYLCRIAFKSDENIVTHANQYIFFTLHAI